MRCRARDRRGGPGVTDGGCRWSPGCRPPIIRRSFADPAIVSPCWNGLLLVPLGCGGYAGRAAGGGRARVGPRLHGARAHAHGCVGTGAWERAGCATDRTGPAVARALRRLALRRLGRRRRAWRRYATRMARRGGRAGVRRAYGVGEAAVRHMSAAGRSGRRSARGTGDFRTLRPPVQGAPDVPVALAVELVHGRSGSARIPYPP